MVQRELLILIILTIAVVAYANKKENYNASNNITYRVTFKSMWNKNPHPTDFLLKSNTSDIIGTIHDHNYYLWKEGTQPSRGITLLTETGNTSVIMKDVNEAVRTDQIGNQFTLPRIRFQGAQIGTLVNFTEENPLVSLATRLYPSDGWMTGLDSVSLKEDGKWVRRKEIELYPYKIAMGIRQSNVLRRANGKDRVGKVIFELQ